MNISRILVYGPVHVGKSTVCLELARRTGRSVVHIDAERPRLYPQIGYSDEECRRYMEEYEIDGWCLYQKPFELYAVKTVLAEHQEAIIDFGGGQCHYTGLLEEQFLQLLESEPNVFQLLPYADPEKSASFLSERCKGFDNGGRFDYDRLNWTLITSECARQAAKFVIYTEEKTPEEIVDEILAQVY